MKNLLLTLMMLLLPVVASAYPVEIDGIYYNLVSKVKIAEVTKGPNEYTGSVTIPDVIYYEGIEYSVTSIGNNAFKDCKGLKSVIIPNSVTSLGEELFRGCTGLTSVTIGNGVTSIPEYAFFDCKNLSMVDLGNNIRTIEDFAFVGCSHLTSIKIPNTVEYIGEAWSFCGLTSVHITDIAAWCRIKFGSNFANPLYDAHNLYLNDEEVIDLVIPYGVSSISRLAFTGCTSIKTVTFPSSVTELGSHVFYECSNLVSVNLPTTLRKLPHYVFWGCSSLTSITIPNLVTTISEGLFWGCISLTTINIPNNVTSIGDDAFRSCTNLTTIEIPDNVITIGRSAFFDNKQLSIIKIGRGIRTISEKAFSNCSALTDFYCYAKNVPYTEEAIFEGSYIDYSTLHVPSESISSYKATAPWENFKNIIETPKYTLTYIIDGEEYQKYEIEEGEVITPEPAPTMEGYIFVGWTEIPRTMPSHDVTVTGLVLINSYKLTYMIDDQVYKETMYEYGATITPESQPEGDYATFEWIDLPETMPAHDVVVYANYSTGIGEVLTATQRNTSVYSIDGKNNNKLKKGLNIVIPKNDKAKKVLVK